MQDTLHIESYCSIRSNKVSLNGDVVFEAETSGFDDFIKEAYYYFETNYPKFFKMDGLSKLGFLASDLILKQQQHSEEDIALLFSNKASSLDTDRKHQHSIQKINAFYPSPSTFVYTLPNIVLGEISIKHKLLSENNFFIFDAFPAKTLYQNSKLFLEQGKANKVLCGWVEKDDEAYEASLFLIGNSGEELLSAETLTRLYKQ